MKTYSHIFTFLIFIGYLQADDIIFQDIKEMEYTTAGLSYIIRANQKTINIDKLKKISLFNRKKVLSDSIYYRDGTFNKCNIAVNFHKGYFFEGAFLMDNCFINYNGASIQATTVEFKEKYIDLRNVILKKNNKEFHKFKYRIPIQ